MIQIIIKELRNQKNISIRALAAEAKVSASHLCDIENGKKSPTIEILY